MRIKEIHLSVALFSQHTHLLMFLLLGFLIASISSSQASTKEDTSHLIISTKLTSTTWVYVNVTSNKGDGFPGSFCVLYAKKSYVEDYREAFCDDNLPCNRTCGPKNVTNLLPFTQYSFMLVKHNPSRVSPATTTYFFSKWTKHSGLKILPSHVGPTYVQFLIYNPLMQAQCTLGFSHISDPDDPILDISYSHFHPVTCFPNPCPTRCTNTTVVGLQRNSHYAFVLRSPNHTFSIFSTIKTALHEEQVVSATAVADSVLFTIGGRVPNYRAVKVVVTDFWKSLRTKPILAAQRRPHRRIAPARFYNEISVVLSLKFLELNHTNSVSFVLHVNGRKNNQCTLPLLQLEQEESTPEYLSYGENTEGGTHLECSYLPAFIASSEVNITGISRRKIYTFLLEGDEKLNPNTFVILKGFVRSSP